MSALKLYDFPFSSASFRLRIACNLKGVDYNTELVNIREDAQNRAEYLAVNPTGLVPALRFADGFVLSQSLAVMQYLDAVSPEPRLFPEEPRQAALVWEFALTVACDTHPLNNLRVLKYLRSTLNADENQINAWYSTWVAAGLTGLETRAKATGGPYCIGECISAADICLVPQMLNARRFRVDLDAFPTLVAIDKRLSRLPAFQCAFPEE